jgi:hypothetical protein
MVVRWNAEQFTGLMGVFEFNYYSAQKMEKKRTNEITAIDHRAVDRRFLSLGGASADIGKSGPTL